ncbi:MAG TPA: TolC family protein, partial [Thermoanaerobaculia bacterium]|nr:TolC family protein [Thermoanaerobaculia bacterium]
ELVGPAGALDDPKLELRLDNMGFDRISIGDEEMSRVEVGARQALPFPGKREARRALARAETAMAEAELAAAERELELEIARSAAELYARDRELVLLDEIHELLQLMSATVAARYGAGEGDQRALVRVHLSTSKHDALREEAGRARDAAAAELRGALALPAEVPMPRVDRLWAVGPPPEALAARAVSEAPEVAVRAARVAIAERRLAIERLELRPDLSLAGGLVYRGDLDPGFSLGVGVELPLWRRRRQEPRVRAAEQELRAARESLRAAELAARADGERLEAAFDRLQRSLALYSEGVVPQSAMVFDVARSGYLAGRGELAIALDDLGAWLEARVELARLEAERAATAAEITALVAPQPTVPLEGDAP